VVYSYLKVVTQDPSIVGQRQRKTFSFVCEDIAQCQPWVDAIQKSLNQNPEKYLVVLDTNDKNAVNIWDTIKTMLDIAKTNYDVKSFTEPISTLPDIQGLLLIATDNKIYQLLNVLASTDENYGKALPVAIIPSSLSKTIEYPPNLTSFLQNPIMIAYAIIKRMFIFAPLYNILYRKNYLC
jgi:hypothetical protein